MVKVIIRTRTSFRVKGRVSFMVVLGFALGYLRLGQGLALDIW